MVKQPLTRIWRVLVLVISSTIVLLVAALTLGLYFYFTEIQVTEYKSIAEATADGAIARGWLPEWVPASATNIREVHDLDTNAQWISFNAISEDLSGMIKPFPELPYVEARRTALLRPWLVGGDWPPELSSPLLSTPRDIHLLGYYGPFKEPFRDPVCVAVEWLNGRACIWSCEMNQEPQRRS